MYKPLIGAALVIFSNSLWADTTHIVAKGDTIGKIAKQYYGNSLQWKDIYQANKALIGNDSNYLEIGWSLTIPGIAPANTSPAEKTPPETPAEQASSSSTSPLSAAKPAQVATLASSNEARSSSEQSVATTPPSSGSATAAEDPQAAIAAAIVATQKADEVGYEWRDTHKLIKQAQQAAEQGDAAKAIQLAQQAQAQSERAYEQAMAQKDAAPRI